MNTKEYTALKMRLSVFVANAVFLASLFASPTVSADEPAEDKAGSQPSSKADEAAAAKRFQESQAHLKNSHLALAAAGFRELALNHAGRDIGRNAVPLYFESVAQAIAAGDEKPVNEATGTAAEIHDLFCVRAQGKPDEALCAQIVKIHCQLARLSAEKLMKLSDKSVELRMDYARRAADSYASLILRYGGTDDQLRSRACGAMDEILYNAGLSYRAAGDANKSLVLFRKLAGARKVFPSSPLVDKAVWIAGGISLSLGEFEDAARYFEQYARESPQSERADDALSDAAVLRLGLSDDKKAEQNAELYIKLYGAKKPAEAANVALAIGLHRLERNDFRGAESQLSKSMAMIDKSGRISVAMRGHAALGRAYEGLKRGADADKQYQWVVSAFRDAGAATTRIMREEPGGGERQLAKALTALGEATFHFAEKERLAAAPEKLPLPKDKTKLSQYGAELHPILQRRLAQIERAEKAYLKVLNIQPMPPPQWVIASGSRVADMWSSLSDEIQSIGDQIKKDLKEPVKKAMGEEFASIASPWFERARQASKTCLSYSVKFAYASEYSKRCEAWLTRNVPKEFPPITEFAPAFQLNRTPFLLSRQPFPEPKKATAP